MTTKRPTGLLTIGANRFPFSRARFRAKCVTLAFGAIQWPWLLRSLYGGTRAEKQALLRRIDLPQDALPHLGSWKADTFFLHRIVDTIESLRPEVVVELGSGASSLIIARALALNGGGRLVSYDQHAPFVAGMAQWLAEHDLAAEFRHAPLSISAPKWGADWYRLAELPASIDLLVVDGPPWSVHPFIRGAAEKLFPLLSPRGVILLDDAARPGEQIVASRWRRDWKEFAFEFEAGGTKGMLRGTRSGSAANARDAVST
ncbi:class I SAM-dependent methyltransferase [Novosphingobium sp. CF614]|uniref:class I SAM-dependent methyltransferase n=1 Tax=Novosphingobium sp. CF614 TaxID=1884364 RepID=UPI0021013051|nr:class I SAM-dependent methyltransferase [Novosphingobium sp. CF614]